jgi:hypothetical protein
MSKYQPLSARLAGHAGPEWRATFAELEKVLGFALPKAARNGRAWWKADAGAHARAWTQAGWTADEVDHAAGMVIFRKTDASADAAMPKAAGPPAVADEPPILKRLEPGPGWGVALVLGGVAIVAGVGALALRGMMRKLD